MPKRRQGEKLTVQVSYAPTAAIDSAERLRRCYAILLRLPRKEEELEEDKKER